MTRKNEVLKEFMASFDHKSEQETVPLLCRNQSNAFKTEFKEACVTNLS